MKTEPSPGVLCTSISPLLCILQLSKRNFECLVLVVQVPRPLSHPLFESAIHFLEFSMLCET